jgi:hypothetical protein
VCLVASQDGDSEPIVLVDRSSPVQYASPRRCSAKLDLVRAQGDLEKTAPPGIRRFDEAEAPLTFLIPLPRLPTRIGEAERRAGKSGNNPDADEALALVGVIGLQTVGDDLVLFAETHSYRVIRVK